MPSIKGTKFFGHQVSAYGIENHRVDFLTLSMAFDCVMNNNIINVGEWYLLCGEEYDDEGYPLEVYQYYIISRAGSEILHRWTDEIIYYNEELDMYLWCVTHYGTSWNYVLTDIEIEEE